MLPHDNIPLLLKHCQSCREKKPSSEFWRCKSAKDGLQGSCKPCQKKSFKEWTTTHRAYANEKLREWRNEHLEHARALGRKWQVANRQKTVENARRYRAEHPGKDAETQRRRRREHPEQQKEGWARYRQRHPEKVRAQMAAIQNNRRTSKGSHTAEDVLRQLKAQKGRCYYCGEKLNGKYHEEHIIPLCRGGTNNPDNIVCACQQCNYSKGKKLPHEWPEGGRLC